MRFKDFEIRECTNTNDKYNNFELLKWYKNGEKEFCYVVAFITWNPKEPCWEFQSVGMRFIDDYEDGLCEYVKKFMELVGVTYKNILQEYIGGINMRKKYIDPEVLKASFEEDGHLSSYIEEFIDDCPAADVEPVKHGHWIGHEDDF